MRPSHMVAQPQCNCLGAPSFRIIPRNCLKLDLVFLASFIFFVSCTYTSSFPANSFSEQNGLDNFRPNLNYTTILDPT